MRAFLFALAAFLLPAVTFAASTKVQDILCTVGAIVGQLTPIIAGLALVAFFWGLVMYLFSLSGSGDAAAHMGGGGYGHGMAAAASPQGKQMGRSLMFWGIVVLFVMVSVWGLVRILQQTFDVTDGGALTPPQIVRSADPQANAPTIYSCGRRN